MPIIGFSLDTLGQVGNEPRFIYLNTNDTIAKVTTTGYLNRFVQSGNKVKETDLAVVVTRTSQASKTADVNLFNVTYANGSWSLTPLDAPLAPGSVTLAALAPGITPGYICVLAGKYTNVGSTASFTIPVTGALGTDIAMVQYQSQTTASGVLTVLPGLNTINVTCTAAPGASVVSYQVLRAVS